MKKMKLQYFAKPTVKYNGATVATIDSGEVATLPIQGKKMTTDITVTVPSEYIVPSGTVSISSNGTHNVSGKASAEVNVTPSLQSKTVTANGDVTADSGYDGLSKVTVNVEAEDSATPIEVSTEAEMTALLTSGEVGGVYKYTGTTGTYESGALYVLEVSE